MRCVSNHFAALLLFVVSAVASPAAVALAADPGSNVDLPRYPAVSPDGKTVVFSWRGDLWSVSTSGGHAERLTTHPRDDLRSAWSRDGKRIAFESDRDGYNNLYTMNADGTDVREVSHFDGATILAGWGVDETGKEVLTFHSSHEGDNYRASRPFMISVDGGEIRRLHGAFGNHPVVSPDGRYVAFTRGESSWTRRHYMGPDARDAWLFDRQDKSFKRMTQWKGNDGMARWAGNDTLIFASDRKLDCVNLYRMSVGGGDASAEQLTSFDVDDVQDFDVSADGSTVVMMTWDTLYRLDLKAAGAKAEPIVITANEDEADNYQMRAINRSITEAALSPDGKVMAMIAYGEVYVRNLEEKSPTRRVTSDHARDKEIVWSPDGLSLYFVSDRDGTESIYAATVALTRGEIKKEFEEAKKKKAEEAKKADDAKASTQEADKSDEKKADGADKPADKPADEKAVDPVAAWKNLIGKITGTDEKKSDEKSAEKKPKKETPKELDPGRWHDAVRFDVKPIVLGATDDRQPVPSPDGMSLAFRRGRGDLMVMDLATGETKRLAEGWDTGLHWTWSYDSKNIAYAQSDLNFNSDIWIVPADGSAAAVNITRHPDNDGSPRWSADSKILSFVSERVNEEYDVWMVYLDKDLDALTPKELEKYYDDAAAAAKKRKPLDPEKLQKEMKKRRAAAKKAASQAAEADSDDAEGDNNGDAAASQPEGDNDAATESSEGDDKSDGDKNADEKKDDDKKADKDKLDLDDAWLRLQRVTSYNGSEVNNELTPGGDRYVFSSSDGGSGIYSLKWDRSDKKKLSGPASVMHINLAGDTVVMVSGSRAATVKVGGGAVTFVDISDRIRIDLMEQASQKFMEAARAIGENFYHPTMKDLDWEALSQKYHKLARQSRTADEFNYVANRLLGELNGSHLGIRAPQGGTSNALPLGRLGTIHHRTDKGFEVTQLIDKSPAATGPMALKVGDVITEIELQPIGETDTVESMLAGRSGEETIVTVLRKGDDGVETSLQLLLTPISSGAERGLKYEMWRNENARKVEEWSDGKLGYIHIQGMDQGSLDVFERDLYAAAEGKAGLLIDVRNNGGGWTTDRLLTSIIPRRHAYTVPRGATRVDTNAYPQDRYFIQHYNLPINMLCNEKSFSNAEIISHAFKTLKRGTLVGQQTYGGVISTGGIVLIDGTTCRMPFRGWYLPDGTDMENHGAMPDILVPQTPEDESADNDAQLRAAVDDLLKRT